MSRHASDPHGASSYIATACPAWSWPEQVEKDIDAAVKHDADSLLTSAVKLLNLSDGPTQTFDVTLVGYPDKEARARLGIPIGGRIGVDKRPRVTPVAVTAIKLWPSRLAIYNGTVSLITGEMVEERLLEVGYKDIVILERQSLARPQPANAARKEAREDKARKPARRRSLHEKDLLAIHFANQQSIEIVLRDSRFAAPLNAGELDLTAPATRSRNSGMRCGATGTGRRVPFHRVKGP